MVTITIVKKMENKITILTIAILAVAITTITTIPTANASSSGGSDGKRQGHIDAMNGYPADASCGSGRSNDYCASYKIAYNIEYYWTTLVQD
jgi:hypothetical protein